MKVVEINEKPHKCPMCEVRFTDRRNIPRHIKNNHPKVPHKLRCILCKKLYQTKGNHDQHFAKAHMDGYLLYTDPELVKIQGNSMKYTFSHTVTHHNIIHTLFLEWFTFFAMGLIRVINHCDSTSFLGPILTIELWANEHRQRQKKNPNIFDYILCVRDQYPFLFAIDYIQMYFV